MIVSFSRESSIAHNDRFMMADWPEGVTFLRGIQVMFRLLFSLISVSILFSGVVAQDKERLIDALQAKYNRLGTFSADFTQIHTSPGEPTRRESGHLLLKKPGKMRWDYSGAEKKLFLSDGRFVYEYVPSDGFATRASLKEADDMRAPFAFLLGRGDLRKDFQRFELGVESPARAGNTVLRMIPRREQDFRALIVEFDSVTLQLQRLSFVDQNGSRSDFLFSGVQENIPAVDSRFALPAGVEVRK